MFASLLLASATPPKRLAVSGTHFTFAGEPVFLAGANQPWLHYGADFGNHRPTVADYCRLKNDYLQPLRDAGGHSMRFWLFVEGASGIPLYDADGMVNGTDAAGSLAEDMRKYVRLAASMDVLVTWCLWNGAVLRDPRTMAMILEPSGAKLRSFIDNALTPLVAALADEPGIGSWEIMNEPEGSVLAGASDPEPCFDTTPLKGSGAGWAQLDGHKGAHPIPMKYLQRFVAWQSAAVHAAAPAALTTVGSWNAKASSDEQGFRNYWSDRCLALAAGAPPGCSDVPPAPGTYSCAQQKSWGKCDAKANPWMAGFCCKTCFGCAAGCGRAGDGGAGRTALDFAEIHSYSANGGWDSMSPFVGRNATQYGLDKPLVIGEFPADALNGGLTETQLYEFALLGGYAGAWGWALDGRGPGGTVGNSTRIIGDGIAGVRARTGFTVGGAAPPDSCPPPPAAAPYAPQPRPACTDNPPAGNSYTCAQQKSWGKCGDPFMRGFCCRTCFGCAGILQCG